VPHQLGRRAGLGEQLVDQLGRGVPVGVSVVTAEFTSTTAACSMVVVSSVKSMFTDYWIVSTPVEKPRIA
jgi:hypothetical protein